MQSLVDWTASEGQAYDIVAQCAKRLRASACDLLVLQLQRVGHLQSQTLTPDSLASRQAEELGSFRLHRDLLPPVDCGAISRADQRNHAIDVWAEADSTNRGSGLEAHLGCHATR